MEKPIFNINDTITSEAVVGFVKDVFVSTTRPDQFVYEIEEPETESLLYFHEEELTDKES